MKTQPTQTEGVPLVLAASGDHKRAYREAERKLKAFAELFGTTAPRVAA